MKTRMIWIGFVVIVVSWGMNYLYFQSKQLVQPIFLKHYTELYITEGSQNQLTFYFLTNKHDTAKVTNITADGVRFYPLSPSFIWSDNQQLPHYEQEFRHQHLRSVTIDLQEDYLSSNQDFNNAWSFKEIEVGYSNGTTQKVNIGEVRLVPATSADQVLESRMKGSSNQHWTHEAFVTKAPVTIDDIQLPFDNLRKDIKISVNTDQKKLRTLDSIHKGHSVPDWSHEKMDEQMNDATNGKPLTDFAPFHLQKNEWMHFMIYTNPARKSIFEFSVMIHGKTEDGKEFTTLSPIVDRPYLSQKDINEIIAEQRGGKND